MITTFAVSGYRSLRDLVIGLGPLTVVTGANGSGKSNLYRALQLLAATGTGDVIGAIAREGGVSSALWAGPEAPTGAAEVEGTRRKGPVAIRLGFAADELGYLIDLGLPQTQQSVFRHDPEIKREQIFAGAVAKPATLLVDRLREGVRVRDEHWTPVRQVLATYESILTDLAEGDSGPELLGLRRTLAAWRFYDHFRVDPDAPARSRQVGTRAHTLTHTGANLASVWATITEAGFGDRLDAAVDAAFPGARVTIDGADEGFELAMSQPGLLRPLRARELSDGTLRYLLLCAALLPARPAPLIVLNEPESSLHPSLLPPLAELIARASAETQVLVVSHADALVGALTDATVHHLERDPAGTRVRGQGLLDQPPWHWGSR